MLEHVVVCNITFFRAYLRISLCRLVIISCLRYDVCRHIEVDMYTHSPHGFGLILSGDIELCVLFIHHNTLSTHCITEESLLSVYHLDSLNVFIV